MPVGFRSRLTLVLLTLAVAYSALMAGGDLSLDSNITLLVVGLASLAGVASIDRRDGGPLDPVLLAALLLPVYIVVQLVPLPLPLLAVVDPARAEIAEALRGIGVDLSWAPLSVSAAARRTCSSTRRSGRA